MKKSDSAVLIGGLAFLLACAPTSDAPIEDGPIDAASLATERYGMLESGDPAGMFSRIADGTMTSRYVVGLDRAEPFVHVFERTSGNGTAFGKEGQGPGEISDPFGLEMSGDSTVVVLNRYALSWYDLRGEWQEQVRLPETHGISPMSIAAGCGGRWFAYGPEADLASPERILHEISLDDPPVTRTIALEGDGGITWGALYGFDATDEGVLLWRRGRTGRPGIPWWMPCEGSPEVLGGGWLSAAGLEGRGRPPEATPTDDGEILTLPDTSFAGAAIGPTPIIAFGIRSLDLTVLEALGDTDCRTATLIGRWTVSDANGDELLMYRQNPFPELIVMRWSDLEPRANSCPG